MELVQLEHGKIAVEVVGVLGAMLAHGHTVWLRAYTRLRAERRADYGQASGGGLVAGLARRLGAHLACMRSLVGERVTSLIEG